MQGVRQAQAASSSVASGKVSQPLDPLQVDGFECAHTVTGDACQEQSDGGRKELQDGDPSDRDRWARHAEHDAQRTPTANSLSGGHIDLVKKAATKMAYFDAACPIPDLFTWASAAHDEVQCRWNKKRSEALPELLVLRTVLGQGELLLMSLACTYSELQSAKLSGNGPQHLGRNTMCVSCICAHTARLWSHSTDVKDLRLLGSRFCSFVCSLRSPWSLWHPVECVLATLDVNRHGIASQRLHRDVHANCD